MTLDAAVGLLPAITLVLVVGIALGLIFAAVDQSVLSGRGQSALMPLRSATLALFERRRVTLAPDRLLWRAGSAAVPILAVLSLAVVPIGERTLLSSNADLVWFNAMEVLLWAAVWLIGWGPNSVHALIGGYRFLAQGLAYELPLMLSLITAGLGAGSLRSTDVVAAQTNLWFIVSMPIAFLIFLAGATALAFWGPFGAPGGADIASGVFAELSGLDRLLVQAGRSIFLGATAAMASTLFLGGGNGPLLPDWAWMLIKTVLLMVVMVHAGRRLPVLRADRLLDLAWIVAVPAILVQALAVALLVLNGFYP